MSKGLIKKVLKESLEVNGAQLMTGRNLMKCAQ